MQAQHWFRPRRNEIPYFEHNADNLIFGYRELQRPMHAFSPESSAVLQRLVSTVFPENANLMRIHLLDLAPDGHIAPHVDHVDYSGDFIVGLSLLTDSVMTLHHRGIGEPETNLKDEKSTDVWLPMYLPRRSLYVLQGEARYDWAHAVPQMPEWNEEDSQGTQSECTLPIVKGRRLAVIFRDVAPVDAPRWRKWRWEDTGQLNEDRK